MKVVTLLENNLRGEGLVNKHGLSLYVEVKNTKVLFDVGPDDAFIKNAERLNINIEEIDICIISHGHYDHGGGLEAFLERNKKAKVYISRQAFGDFFIKVLGFIKYDIGLNKKLMSSGRFIYVDGPIRINNEIQVLTEVQSRLLMPSGNLRLFKKTHGGYEYDTFEHEIYMLVSEENRNTLFTGCSHRGIVNILDTCKKSIQNDKSNDSDKDLSQHIDNVIGGMHLMNLKCHKPQSQVYLNRLINEMKQHSVGKYYTCHCTGEDVYDYMKTRMENSITDLQTGDCIEL